jgi:hypothetical protein
MQMPVPNFTFRPERDAQAIVRVVTREDVLWNRPVFRAPPLEIKPPVAPVFPGDLDGPLPADR